MSIHTIITRETPASQAELQERAIEKAGSLILELAEIIYEYCHTEVDKGTDFQVMKVNQRSITFGSTNQVRWSPVVGWSVDPSSSTERFRSRFVEWSKMQRERERQDKK